MKRYAKAVENEGHVQLIFGVPKEYINENDQFVEEVLGDSEATAERFEKKYKIRVVERFNPACLSLVKNAAEAMDRRYYGWFLKV